MEESKVNDVIVKMPIDMLTEIATDCGPESLLDLGMPFAVVFRKDEKITVKSFIERDGAVDLAGKIAWDNSLELVAILKNGVPRNYKIDLNVRFR